MSNHPAPRPAPAKPAGISILTWKAPKTLRNTLAALAPIYPLFSEHYVLCQEGDPEEIEIARQFGYTPVTTDRNLGIQEGLARCAELPEAETVMVMECDCMLRDPQNAAALVARCITLLDEQDLQAIQLQVRPEQPTTRYWHYWKPGFPLRPTLAGRLRRESANARTNEAVCLPDFPHQGIDDIEPLGDGIFVARSNTLNWCNRSFLTTKGFFLDTLIRFAREHPTSRKVNGLPDLEHPINCPQNRHWWRGQKFRIGIVYPGLFGHHRLERPQDDEKKVI
ncbi:hypothetical protein NOF55_05440 [Rhizobiaceae bacterium BDR2-2]|uniref:Glycosyl transferase family 2 n=1 Tax=Ectorhizobium quercum TaxID=2965071 RepID=A0AAE3N0E5_9HYPH|nr:hypothetical protein [Ectorhizobium quercum]MCX8996542.1 hypothetical protein [Ectorhizobium quercum]